MARLSGFFRQPLLHFLLIGVAIFALYAALNESPSTTSAQEIIITDDKVTQLAAGFRSARRRPPTVEELNGLIDDFLRGEVLAREAVALSLDRDDAIIRRRLRQKMEFLTDSAAAALKPSDEELRGYFDANPERYSTNARVAFQQVFVGTNPSADEIARAREALSTGSDPLVIGERTLLPPSLPLSVQTAVDGTFGGGFFESLSEAETGVWVGPMSSGYGIHLVRIVERVDAEIPPFDEVREAVLRDWKGEKSREFGEMHYARILARYTVTRPDPSSVEVVE